MESSTRTTRVSSHTFDSGDNLALRTADSWECEVERPGREGGVGRERRRVHLAVTQRPNLPPVWGTSENSPYPGKQAHAKLASEPVPPTTHRGLLCISRRASSPAAPPSHSPSPAPVSPLPRRPSCPPPGPSAPVPSTPPPRATRQVPCTAPSSERGRGRRPDLPDRRSGRRTGCLRRRRQGRRRHHRRSGQGLRLRQGLPAVRGRLHRRLPQLHQQHHPVVPAGRLADRPTTPRHPTPLGSVSFFVPQSLYSTYPAPHIIYTPHRIA